MTTNTKLKRQARQRQDITGEPYMEALRRVREGGGPVQIDNQLWGRLQRGWLHATEVLHGPQTDSADPAGDPSWREFAEMGIPRPGLDRDGMGVLVGQVGADQALTLVRAGYVDPVAAAELVAAADRCELPLDAFELELDQVPFTVDDGQGGAVTLAGAHEDGLLTAEQVCWLRQLTGDADVPLVETALARVRDLAVDSLVDAAETEARSWLANGMYDAADGFPPPDTIDGWIEDLLETCDDLPVRFPAGEPTDLFGLWSTTRWPSEDRFSEVEDRVAPLLDGLPPQFDEWRRPGFDLHVEVMWRRALERASDEARCGRNGRDRLPDDLAARVAVSARRLAAG